MKKIALFIFFTFSSLQAQLIDSTIVRDFKQKGTWPEFSEKDKSSQLTPKGLELDVDNKLAYVFYQSWEFFEDQMVTMETSFTPVKFNEKSNAGLIFGFRSWVNYNFFMISPDGEVLIKSITNYVHTIWYKKKSEWVNKDKAKNVLRIDWKEQDICFYVNDHEILKAPRKLFRLHQNNFGFIVENNMEILADYMKSTFKVKKRNEVVTSAKIKLSPMDEGINSTANENGIGISLDKSHMYINRHQHIDNLGGKWDTDIWESQKNAKGNWTKPRQVPGPINDKYHNYLLTLMPTGNKMYVGNHYEKSEFGEGKGVSFTYLTEKGWQLPKPVIIEEFENLKSEFNAFVSHDEQFIILAIEKKDSYGLTDLYVCFRKRMGNYSKPKNLGKIINSNLSETVPYLAYDNKTLYFGSDGHSGYGSIDIYMAKRLDDSWENWSTPVNLGNGINSNKWDAYFNVTPKGDQGWMARQLDEKDIDFFQFNLPEEIRPEPVVVLNGRVNCVQKEWENNATITSVDLLQNKPIHQFITPFDSGNFTAIFNYGSKYLVRATQTGGYGLPVVLDYSSPAGYAEVRQELKIEPLRVNHSIHLPLIQFSKGTKNWEANTSLELDYWVELLTSNRDWNLLEIKVGGKSEDATLAQEQLDKLVHYLTDKGVDAARLTTKIDPTQTEGFWVTRIK